MSEYIPYEPSNGTEAECFISQWCNNCKREQKWRDTETDACEILTMSMAFCSLDGEYPVEWRQDGPSGPRCTAFQSLDEPDAPEPLDLAAVIRPLL